MWDTALHPSASQSGQSGMIPDQSILALELQV